MSTTATVFELPATRRAQIAAAEHDPFAPGEPLLWKLGRLRYADEEDAPPQLRLREKGRRVWYDTMKTPRTSPEDRPVFPDERGWYYTRAEARAYCRDRMDFVVGFPVGREPFGDELFDVPTFCRPFLDSASREKDRRDADAYAESDLRAHVSAELHAEVVHLRELVAHYEGKMLGAAERLNRKCETV